MRAVVRASHERRHVTLQMASVWPTSLLWCGLCTYNINALPTFSQCRDMYSYRVFLPHRASQVSGMIRLSSNVEHMLPCSLCCGALCFTCISCSLLWEPCFCHLLSVCSQSPCTLPIPLQHTRCLLSFASLQKEPYVRCDCRAARKRCRCMN